MADRHNGCFVCGGGQDAILTSIPDYRDTTSIAVCAKCYALSSDELRKRIDSIRAAMKMAREVAARA